MDAFAKAENWRSRASELRCAAAQMREPAAQASLLKIAAALEQHATKLEAVTLLCRLRRRRPAAMSIAS